MNKNKINNPTIGSDPELFLFSEENNKFVPVCGLVGGTKNKPIPISEEGHMLQEDNVALEYCIPPCKTKEEWLKHHNFVKNYITETILKPLNLVPKYVASARFDHEDLQSDKAQLMGCATSYNVYTLVENEVDRSDYNLRTSGCHIHIGYDSPSGEVNISLVKAMDLFVGVSLVLLDDDNERNKMYGKAGEFRFKDYGLEYRVPSGFVISSNELLSWIYDATMQAIDFVNINGIITNEQEIVDCINTSNKEAALELLEEYRITIPEYLTVSI